MEAIPRKYGEWSQFDRYCKLVLYHEAIDYLREMKCRRDREVSLDAVSPADWDKLSTVDRYSCDSFTFSSHGYDLHIDNELVAEAFASLPKDEQSILILRFVLDLTDEEIGRLMGMSRSAVQRHRTSTLKSSKGTSIYAYEPNSPVSKAYAGFTKEVLADGRQKERLHAAHEHAR